MEMSSSDVKIVKSKLLQKYTHIKTTLYIIEKTKLNQNQQPKQRKLSWARGLLLFRLFGRLGSRFDLNNYKKDEIEQEPFSTCLNNAVTGSLISADHIKGHMWNCWNVLRKKKKKEFRIEREKVINYVLDGRDTMIRLIAGYIKET